MCDLHDPPVPSLESISISHSPVPASKDAREPLNDHDVYCAGLDASREGTDLADLVFVAFARWPDTAREVCQAIASAAVGWCADQWRRAEP